MGCVFVWVFLGDVFVVTFMYYLLGLRVSLHSLVALCQSRPTVSDDLG